MLPLAEKLRDVGHDVRVACSEELRPWVEQSGLRPQSLGIESVSEALRRTHRLDPFATAKERDWWFFNHAIVGWTAAASATAILRNTWTPDLIVRDPLEFGGFIAGEKLGVPHVTGREGPFWSPSRWESLAGPTLRKHWDYFRIRDDFNSGKLYRLLGLAFTTPRWLLDDDYISPTMLFCRPPDSDCATRSAWRLQCHRRPKIYFTGGTVVSSKRPYFELGIQGLSMVDCDATVTIGFSHQVQDLVGRGRVGKADINVVPFLAQAHIVAESDLIVCHGGFSTVMGALAFGIPMVVMPISGDQHRNARRCASAGVGLSIVPESRSPHTLASAVHTVLADDSYRANARVMEAELALLPTAESIVPVLEGLSHLRLMS